MAEVLFNNVFLLIFLLFLQLESFLCLCYNNLIYTIKTLKIFRVTNTQQLINITITGNLYFVILFILVYSFKLSTIGLGQLFMLTILYLWQVNKFSKKTHNVGSGGLIDLMLPSFIIILFLLFQVDSFLNLFFFIELYGVLYYFTFLTSYNLTNQTLFKYKNGLILLLWNNFLTTFFLTLGCFFLMRFSGSTNFSELFFLDYTYFSVYLYLLGFFWKLGLPLFHFFKLEVYRYLIKENIFFFSILTTLINFVLLYIVFSKPVILYTLQSTQLLLFFFIFSIILAILNLKIFNFLQFFALSSIFTLSTVTAVFLV